jgi:hypothetical protein
MEMEDQLTPTQIKIIAGWSHIISKASGKLFELCYLFSLYLVQNRPRDPSLPLRKGRSEGHQAFLPPYTTSN